MRIKTLIANSFPNQRTLFVGEHWVFVAGHWKSDCWLLGQY